MQRDCLRVRIADMVWEILLDIPLRDVDMERFYPFGCDGAGADVGLRVHHGSLPDLPYETFEVVFQCHSRWRLYRDRGQYIIEVGYWRADGKTVRARVGVFDKEFRTGEIYVDTSVEFPPEKGSKRSDPLDLPVAQVLMVSLLAGGAGVFMHASGIDHEGKGYLFVGNSGQGKSTMARQWKDRGVLLNDDRMVIRKREGQYWVYGTPWHGELPDVSPGGVPLDKVFLLRHGDENRVQPVRGAGAVGKLLARCFPPLWDAEGMRFTLDFLGSLVEQCPVYELSFVPDKRVVDLVRCVS